MEVLPTTEIDGIAIRIIAGRAFGLEAPVPFSHPIAYADCEAQQEATLEVRSGFSERALYVAEGSVKIDSEVFEAGQMILLEADADVTAALSGDARVMFVAGEPYPEPRHIWWNFVSSRLDRLEQAKQDWREWNFERVPGETEFIPLPD
ncbi:MAG: pirin-like C-terminal cupin domain-containing protein, partial [Pseudomonadota bacterium]